MEAQHKCPTVLLSDTPAYEDGFNAHSAIAKAMAELISTEDGGKYIGLEGDWGSGKSTVINLLEAELRDRERLEAEQSRVVLPDGGKTKLIRFDAWSHQGDPLRRTFLETLMQELGAWIDQGESRKRRDELAGRRETTKTTKTLELFFWGKAMIITVMVLTLLVPPLFKAWLDGGLIWMWFGREFDQRSTFASLWLPLICLPYVLVRLRQRCQRDGTRQKLEESRRWSFLVDPDKGIDPWCFFLNKFDTDVTADTLKTTDPTSVDFRKNFIAIMQEALPVGSTNRVILVLDNLDRIPREDALSMWSTMQTFLSNSEYSGEPWFGRVWVIVPYDRKGIDKLWKPEGEDETTDDDTASYFLDKSFQIVFQVPPLSLADWRRYLRERLLEALPTHEPADFDEVCNLYATHRDRDGRTPTPRELILLVNQIGALHRGCSQYERTNHEIALSHIAYYVLLRRDKHNTVASIIRDLRLGQGVADEMEAKFGRDSLVKFAALAFGVDIRRAQQLLLREPIESALTDRKPALLRMYSGYDGFWDVLQLMQIGSLVGDDGKKLFDFAFSIAQMETDTQELRMERPWLCQELESALSRIERVQSVIPMASGGIEAILGITRSSGAASHVSDLLQTCPLPASTADLARTDTEIWVDVFVSMLSMLDAMGFERVCEQGVVCPDQQPSSFIAGCIHLHSIDADGHCWPKLRTGLASIEIAAALSDLLPDDTSLKAIAVLRDAGILVDWKTVSSRITELLSEIIPADQVKTCIQILWQVRQEASAQEALSEIAVSGSILEGLDTAKSAGDTETVAWCLLAYLHELAYTEGVSTKPAIGNAAFTGVIQGRDPKLVGSFTGLLSHFGELDLLLDFPLLGNVRLNLLYACLREVAKGTEAATVFTPERVIAKWQRISVAIPAAELGTLFARLAAQNDLIAGIRRQGFRVQLCEMYSVIVSTLVSHRSEFAAWCVEGLRGLDAATWLEQLHKGGIAANLMLVLLGCGIKVELGESYLQAMVSEARKVLTSAVEPTLPEAKWRQVFMALTPDDRRDLRRHLLQMLIDSDRQGNQQFLKRYHDELLDDAVLRENQDTVARLLIPMLRSEAICKLEWLRNAFVRYPRLVHNYRGKPEGIAKLFRELVADICAAGHRKEVDELLLSIAKVLNIVPKKKPGLRGLLRSLRRP